MGVMEETNTHSPVRAAFAALKTHGIGQAAIGQWCGVTQQSVGRWFAADRLPADAALTIEHELVLRGISGITRRDLCPKFPWHLAEAPAACGAGKAGAGTTSLCATAPAVSPCTEEAATCNES